MGLGDEIMVTGRARVMQESDPRKVRVTYQGKLRWSPVFDNNPRIARLEERGDFQELPARGVDNHRPYHTGKTPERWTYNLGFRADRGEFYFTDAEREFGKKHAGKIFIEPCVKLKASPNKQWGWERWKKLAASMRARGLTPTQILGAPDARRMEGVDAIAAPSFRAAIAAIATARACVLPEGGLHHGAAAVGTPAVVIFGGFTPVELTGYPGHRNLGVSLGDACGMRLPCKHCAAEMAKIEPDYVLQQLEEVLK